jgi:tetratricopeptide (TPR) repeat protein
MPTLPKGSGGRFNVTGTRAEIHREALGETAEDVVRDLHAIASAHRDAGDLEKAVKCYESALRVRERQLGADTTDLATLLIDFAGTYTQMGNDAPAMEMLQQAIGKLQGSNDPQLAEALESLGAGYVKWRRHAEAATYYQRARVIWKQDAAKYAKRLSRNAILLAGVNPNQSASAEHRVLTEPLMRVREKFLPSTTKRYTTPHSWNEADATIPINDIPNVASATPSQEPVSQPVAVFRGEFPAA